jgi:outer membrane immunogenic protein
LELDGTGEFDLKKRQRPDKARFEKTKPEENWRTTMKKLLLGTVGLIALGSGFGMAPASAADLAARPVYTKAPAMIPVLYDWSGFYVGINGGGGWSHNCWDNTTAGGAFVGAEGCHNASGGTVGGQIGYRWEANSWVFGVEAQGNWAELKGSNVSTLIPADTNRSKIDAFGLFTGQIGYAWNNVLLYAKGGAAVTDNHNDIYSTATGAFLAGSGDQTRWGGTVGAGLEYGFAPNWSVGVEYDHLFMQDKNVAFTTPAGVGFGFDKVRQDVDLVTARINYRFGGPIIAKY